MFSKIWWGKTLERMVKTAAQALIAFIGADQLITAIDWDTAWQITATMTLLSFLSSILTSNMGSNPQDPSAV
jgi:ABC-type lipoprotein release transport system permease subunit